MRSDGDTAPSTPLIQAEPRAIHSLTLGALLGSAIDNGRSSLLGTLIGGAAGAAFGREIQRGSVRCR